LRRIVAPQIEAIELPQGYHFEWGGEYESQQKATNNLMGSLPMGYLIMFLITVLLFNTIRQPLAIWLTVPLALIGVSAGLLLMNIPFSFTALLGLLSLSGMIVKNGIVLVEQINIETGQGSNLNRAIVDASVSRVRPVCMAAVTTMLGMIPLVFDAFFQSMAVTIIFGLGFATLLTLVVLPVIYALLYRVSYR
jgi:multidrug efflux pump subunit AcrB